MKNGKKIAKIIGATLGVGAICCIIPACVISCGSSSVQSNDNSSNSSSTTQDNSANLSSTSVNNNATSVSWNNTGLGHVLNSSDINNIVSVWKLPTNLNSYTISTNNTSCTSYQWYEIPINVFLGQLNTYLKNYKTENATTAVQLMVQNGNPIFNANTYAYSIAYESPLNDAFFICVGKQDGQTLFSKVTWLQEPEATNLSGLNYSITYSNNYSSQVEEVQTGSNQEELEAPWNTPISFSATFSSSNSTDNYSNYLMAWNAGSVYSNIVSIDDNSSYSFNCTSQTTKVSLLIFNQNGQLINNDESGTLYTISVNDPLKLFNTYYSLTTNSKVDKVTINNQTVDEINITDTTSTAFDLSIAKFTNKSFADYNYQIIYQLMSLENLDNSINSPKMQLFNASSWTYTFKNVPHGAYAVDVEIIDPNGNPVDILQSNNSENYALVNPYVNIASKYANTTYGANNEIFVNGSACGWANINYEWEDSTDNGKTWNKLATGNVQNNYYGETNNNNLSLANITPYSIDSKFKQEEFRLVATNANNDKDLLTSNVITINQNLISSTISYNNSTYQAEATNIQTAYIPTGTSSFDINVSLSQFGKDITNSSDLNGVSLTLQASSSQSTNPVSIFSTSNLASIYDAQDNTLLIPISTSSLTQFAYNDYYGDNGNYLIYPLQFQVSLTQNGKNSVSNSLNAQYLSIDLSNNYDNYQENGDVWQVYSNNSYQLESSIGDYTNYSPKYYQWQSSINGVTNWTNVTSNSYQNVSVTIDDSTIYYRLVIYASSNEQVYSVSNVIGLDPSYSSENYY